MQFDHFLSIIKRLQETELLGVPSHLKMAPEGRPVTGFKNSIGLNTRRAAVIALFYPASAGHTNFLLIQRASYDGTHSSQIGFPGGKFEDTDKDLASTALRETEEEVGVRTTDISIKKELSDLFIPPSNFLVRPFLGITSFTPRFKANHEVHEILEIQLNELLHEGSVQTEKLTTSYMENIDVPCFRLQDRVVWGATAMMLSEIKDLIKLNYH